MTRRLSPESRQRIKEGCLKRIMPPSRGANISAGKTRQIRTTEGVFPSVKLYALAQGVEPITIYKRMKRYPESYSFVL